MTVLQALLLLVTLATSSALVVALVVTARYCPRQSETIIEGQWRVLPPGERR